MKFAGHERDLGVTSGSNPTADDLDSMHARFYNPQIGRFLAVDPGRDWDPSTPQSWNLYAYARNNPLTYVDPDGQAVETAWDAFNVGLGAASLIDNLRNRRFGSALLDAGGLILDGAATVTPFVPGGASSAIKAYRVADRAADGVDAIRASAPTRRLLNAGTEFADHHIIPAFRGKSSSYAEFIRARGINVDQFTVTLNHGRASHHLKFIHGQGKWNQRWKDWIDANPDATAKDIYQFAGKMMDEFGLSGLEIHAYGKGK
jgi:RHS repeat-associated protein